MAKMIIVNEERCMGCKSCVLQCALAHSDAGSLAEALNAETPPQSRIYVEPSGKFGMPLQCHHCEDAPCIKVCPTEAIKRLSPESPVLLDPDSCIGCKFCLIVCPFGVIDVSRNGKAMIKCDMCIERTEVGEEPACVVACPTGACQFVELDDQLRQRRRQVAEQLATLNRTDRTITGANR